MTLDEFIKAVRPGITTWGVLLTFAAVVFAFAKFFWNYEKGLVVENAQKLKDLLGGFHEQHVEPIILAQLSATFYSAYDLVKAQLRTDLYVTRAGQAKPALRGEKELRDYLEVSAMERRFAQLKNEKPTFLDKFSDSADAARFYEHLDHCYDRARTISSTYEGAINSCYRLTLTCAGLGLLLMAGILQVLFKWPPVMLSFWIFASVQLFALGLWYFGRLEFSRRKLLRQWKELEIYGSV